MWGNFMWGVNLYATHGPRPAPPTVPDPWPALYAAAPLARSLPLPPPATAPASSLSTPCPDTIEGKTGRIWQGKVIHTYYSEHTKLDVIGYQ